MLVKVEILLGYFPQCGAGLTAPIPRLESWWSIQVQKIANGIGNGIGRIVPMTGLKAWKRKYTHIGPGVT